MARNVKYEVVSRPWGGGPVCRSSGYGRTQASQRVQELRAKGFDAYVVGPGDPEPFRDSKAGEL